MLVPAYLAGILAIGFVVACCWRAREGAEGAETAARMGVGVFLGLASLAVLVALLLMAAGPKASGEAEWWSQGVGQQFLAASFGWLALAGAGSRIRRRAFAQAAILVIAAGILFGLWGLLVEGGWSNRGPLAVGWPSASS